MRLEVFMPNIVLLLEPRIPADTMFESFGAIAIAEEVLYVLEPLGPG
jgi:hypothetical protein